MAGGGALSRRDFLGGGLQKRRTEIAITHHCLTLAGISCMTCRDECPEEAIAFVPRRGGPFMPVIDAAACTLCAACADTCPAGAIDIPDIPPIPELGISRLG